MIGIVLETDAPAPRGGAAREILAAPTTSPPCPRACWPRRGGWRSTTARRSGSPSSACCPPGCGANRRSWRCAARAGGRRRCCGPGAGRWLEERGGEAAVRSLARALKRPVWDVVHRLASVGAVSCGSSRRTPRRRDRHRARGGPPAESRPPCSSAHRCSAARAAARSTRRSSRWGQRPVATSWSSSGFGEAVIRGLVSQGLAKVEDRSGCAIPSPNPPARRRPDAHAGADRGGRGDRGARGRRGALLFGVTGSGKTLVYLGGGARGARAGRGGDRAGAGDRAHAADGEPVPRRLRRPGRGAAQRALGRRAADAWRLLRRGERRVAVGARSAVFAPVRDLGRDRRGRGARGELQAGRERRATTPARSPRCARSWRARRWCSGSATPSLETLARRRRAAQLLALPERIGGRPLPPVEVVDLRARRGSTSTGPVAWSEALDAAIAATLRARRAGTPAAQSARLRRVRPVPRLRRVWQCPELQHLAHRAPRAAGAPLPLLRHEEPLPFTCRVCANPVQQMRGVGTQQVERLLAERFPRRGSPAWTSTPPAPSGRTSGFLERVERGEVDILIGTQMIAKGLDFPNVTLVGVVDADTGLYLPDFRARRSGPSSSGPGGGAGAAGAQGRGGVGKPPTQHAGGGGKWKGVLGRGGNGTFDLSSGLMVNLVVSGGGGRTRKTSGGGMVAARAR